MHTETQRRATLACASCGALNRVDLGRREQRPVCGKCRAALPLGRPVALTDMTFARVVEGTAVPVLVDFYADWCGPCKLMAPVLDALARDRADRAVIAKLDTDRAPNTAARFGIRSIPTLIVFRDGREVGRELGAVPRQRLDALLDGALRA